MLSINRQPRYKNKFLLITLAVSLGFVVTVGIIRVVNPLVPSTGQSGQTTNDRRASSLIPINASDSEKSPESDNSATSPDATAPTTEKSSSSSPWVAPSKN
ncbi:hypothetical protein H7142_02500 [Candidatus Saccharibacteria bacterium]|nr:hypothetical protein [Candidatus Saccharibacteria bacterium]